MNYKTLSLFFIIILVMSSGSSAFATTGMSVQPSDTSSDIADFKTNAGLTGAYVDKAGNILLSEPNQLLASSKGVIFPNSARTFATTLQGGSVAANRTLNIPAITGTDTLATIGLAQTFSSKQTMTPSSSSSGLNVGTLASDPTSPRQGDMWVSSSFLKYNDNTNTTQTLVNLASTQTISGAKTFSGGITMSSADITLAGNKIKSTNFNIQELGPSGTWTKNAINIQETSATSPTLINMIPQSNYGGAYGGFSAIQLFGTTDYTTNYESLTIGTNFQSGNENVIASLAGGTGTHRPITVYMGTTPSFGVDTSANAGVYATKKLCLDFASDACGNNYIYQSSANVIDVYAGGVKQLTINSGNIAIGGGTNVVYRCATAGAVLPAGSLTINSASCGTTVDTQIRVP